MKNEPVNKTSYEQFNKEFKKIEKLADKPNTGVYSSLDKMSVNKQLDEILELVRS